MQDHELLAHGRDGVLKAVVLPAARDLVDPFGLHLRLFQVPADSWKQDLLDGVSGVFLPGPAFLRPVHVPSGLAAVAALLQRVLGFLALKIPVGDAVYLAHLIERPFLEDFQPLVPDDRIPEEPGHDGPLVDAAANREQDRVRRPEVFAPDGLPVKQDPDQLVTLPEVDFGNLALGTAHRVRVDLVTVGQEFRDLSGEDVVDISGLHFRDLLSLSAGLWPDRRGCLSSDREGRGQMFTSRLEFLALQLQPVDQEAFHDLRFLLFAEIFGVAEVRDLVGVDRPGTHSQTELNVRLDLPGVGRAVEQPEFHGPFRVQGVKVQPPVPSGAVVSVVDAAAVSVVRLRVVHPFQRGFGVLALPHGLQHFLAGLLAPLISAAFILQGFIEEILPPGEEVDKVDQRFRCVVGSVHMDVDSAGIVGHRPSLDQLPDDLLQVLDVIVLEDRADHFAAEVPTGSAFVPADRPAVHPCFGPDGDVAGALPPAILPVQRPAGVVAIRLMMTGCVCSVVVGDDFSGLYPGDPGELDLDSEVLILDGGHCPFPFLPRGSFPGSWLLYYEIRSCTRGN